MLQMAVFHSFLQLSNIPLYIYITSSSTNHLLMHLDYFLVLVIVNCAAMNNEVFFCLEIFFSFQIYT